jgi:hypothetical protein
MSYYDGLAHRIRRHLDPVDGVTELALFGGLGFMVAGNMLGDVIEESLVARVGPDAYDEVLEEADVRPFDFTGREMRGWVFVDPPGVAADEDLDHWLERSLAFATSLPPK